MRKPSRLTKSQLVTLILIALANIFCSSSVSLQAPFYPAEAQKKGATATEHGIVFGSYELTNFLVSPYFGKIVEKHGPKTLLGSGMALSGIAITIFGLLDMIENRFLFIGTSLLLRIFEALGASAAVVSGFSLTANTFPDSVGTVFATMEVFYGAGFIIGPTLGGLLYNIGGFSLPFFTVGIISCIIALVILLMVSDLSEGDTVSISNQSKLMETLKVPAIMFDSIGVIIFAGSVGFFTSTLEPHLQEFNMTPSDAAFIFVISGGAYAITTPIFGRICDTLLDPKILLFYACIVNLVAFSVVGPLPFIPVPSALIYCLIGLFLSGMAAGASNVATFSDSFRSARKAGYPDEIGTYGLLSGIWTSSYALGGFLGPTLAGILFDLAGFRWASFFVVVIYIIFITFLSAFILKDRRQNTNESPEEIEEVNEATTLLTRQDDNKFSFHR